MEQQKTIYQKVFEAKKKFTAITKDQTNPHFRSQYYDINDLLRMVDPIIHEQGLMILQPIKEGKLFTIIYDIESGESIESFYELEHNSNPQKVGSEITYYRRYLLSSLLSLQAEDDDGNKASIGDDKKWLNKDSKEWNNVIKAIQEGKVTSIDDIRKHYKVSKQIESELLNILN